VRTGIAAALSALAVVSVAAAQPAGSRSDCSRTSTGYTPLVDLGTKTYRGQRGGLYAAGRNRPPVAYLERGLDAAAQVRPRSADGRFDRSGAIVVVSVGMSDTTQEFSAFKQLADPDVRRNPRVVIVETERAAVPMGSPGAVATLPRTARTRRRAAVRRSRSSCSASSRAIRRARPGISLPARTRA